MYISVLCIDNIPHIVISPSLHHFKQPHDDDHHHAISILFLPVGEESK